LLDVNGNEISCLAGSLPATQPAGKYYLLIKPQSGSGGYNLTLRAVETSFKIEPDRMVVGEVATASFSLSNVPTEGFTSAEFTCSYDPAFVEVSEIADAGLFGADAVMVVNGPANGSFIAAIAGSNGKRATANGAALTFKVKGLQPGHTPIDCDARVSTGDNSLTGIASEPVILTIDAVIVEVDGNILGKVNSSKLVKVCAYDASNVETCQNADEHGIFNMPLKAGVYKVVASAEGFLKAHDELVTVAANEETLMPQISLRAGDIDGNGVIDQFDAMTIGMSYNMPIPAAADLNNDANIDVLDLEALAANYRLTGPVAWE
jgi:hypothetical protein